MTIQTSKDLRVLLVEDSVESLRLIKSMLEQIGIQQIFTAKDGQQALEFLGIADDLIDVILCDWNMPRMSGIELLRQLRTAEPDLPFLMITGTADLNSVAAAKAVGVTGYLAKPFSRDALEKKMNLTARLIVARQNKF